jgi:glycosyltransferase involved in cell wall biosynthesis
MLLAEGLARRVREKGESDLQITVVTPTPADGMDDTELPFRVVRQPGFVGLLTLLWRSDLIHLAGPCFLPMLLSIFLHKYVTVEHHGYTPICPNGLLVYGPDKTVCTGHFMARRYDLCFRCNRSEDGSSGSILKLLLTFPRRWLTKRVHINFCITSHVERRLQLPNAPVVYHGVRDLVPMNGSKSASGTPMCFAYVGRLVSLKGLFLLLDAAKQLKNQGYIFRLKFIGDGPERSSLENLVDQSGLRTQTVFTGNAKPELLVDLMRDVTVVVMPSVWEETAGLSAIEQMMRGKLVIASNIGGLGEVVDEAGLRFTAGDSRALAACMRRVLDSPDLISQLGVKARQRALSVFHQDQMIEGHLLRWSKLTLGKERSH